MEEEGREREKGRERVNLVCLTTTKTRALIEWKKRNDDTVVR